MVHAEGTTHLDWAADLAIPAEYADPEKRKVGGSTPPLPTHHL